MSRIFNCTFFVLLFSAAIAVAEDTGSANGPAGPNMPSQANASADPEAKMVRGMSILGNNEAPMSLFIVPWKSSELGVEANLTRTLNEHAVPVDREVFKRELDFYEVSVKDISARNAGARHDSPLQ